MRTVGRWELLDCQLRPGILERHQWLLQALGWEDDDPSRELQPSASHASRRLVRVIWWWVIQVNFTQPSWCSYKKNNPWLYVHTYMVVSDSGFIFQHSFSLNCRAETWNQFFWVFGLPTGFWGCGCTIVCSAWQTLPLIFWVFGNHKEGPWFFQLFRSWSPLLQVDHGCSLQIRVQLILGLTLSIEPLGSYPEPTHGIRAGRWMSSAATTSPLSTSSVATCRSLVQPRNGSTAVQWTKRDCQWLDSW